MAGLLISGPAGAGKTQRGKQVLAETPGPAVLVDFQVLYASLMGIERQTDGRYPERLPAHAYAIPLAETTRRVIIAEGLDRGLFVITTNSNGLAERRSNLLSLLGPGATEEIIDPGVDVVRERLSGPAGLSEQCREAIDRWYGSR